MRRAAIRPDGEKKQKNTMAGVLPKDYNKRIMAVKQHFEGVVSHRRSQRRYRSSLLACQRYVLEELQELFRRSERQAELEEKEAAFDVPQIVCSEALREGS